MTGPGTIAGFESPSLSEVSDGAAPAYELKFLLDETQAEHVENWARQRLALDAHGDPALDGAYRTTTLYFDTPDLDVYHRAPAYKVRKFRTRRYGAMKWVFLECKSKWGDRVEKKRTVTPDGDVARLAHPMSLMDWPGHWFHRRLLTRNLRPACQIVYQRTAYVGASAAKPLRLTLDRRVHGVLTDDWSLTPVEGGLPLLSGRVIMEFKFRSGLPAPFKELAAHLRLRPSTVSKYRLCREAWGTPSTSREAIDA